MRYTSVTIDPIRNRLAHRHALIGLGTCVFALSGRNFSRQVLISAGSVRSITLWPTSVKGDLSTSCSASKLWAPDHAKTNSHGIRGVKNPAASWGHLSRERSGWGSVPHPPHLPLISAAAGYSGFFQKKKILQDHSMMRIQTGEITRAQFAADFCATRFRNRSMSITTRVCSASPTTSSPSHT